MKEANDLQRFLSAQEGAYRRALSEIEAGRKQSHWMWFIFPQLRGLGRSETAQHYSIEDKREAEAYLRHPVLGARLVTISQALLDAKSSDAYAIFGSPDDVKLKSSMTLFSVLQNTNPVFSLVLKKFFAGSKDAKTLALLGGD